MVNIYSGKPVHFLHFIGKDAWVFAMMDLNRITVPNKKRASEPLMQF